MSYQLSPCTKGTMSLLTLDVTLLFQESSDLVAVSLQLRTLSHGSLLSCVRSSHLQLGRQTLLPSLTCLPQRLAVSESPMGITRHHSTVSQVRTKVFLCSHSLFLSSLSLVTQHHNWLAVSHATELVVAHHTRTRNVQAVVTAQKTQVLGSQHVLCKYGDLPTGFWVESQCHPTENFCILKQTLSLMEQIEKLLETTMLFSNLMQCYLCSLLQHSQSDSI